MIEELTTAINAYLAKWQSLVESRADQSFFAQLKPTSVGWKTEDLADFDACFNELRDHCDQIHFGWVNDRWLATLHLKEATLPGGLTIIKLMQRRPGSTDATGLDHLDFYVTPDMGSAKEVSSKEPALEWTEEKNGEHCKWLSIWFDGTEAKLRSDTVLEVCAAEMRDLEKEILA